MKIPAGYKFAAVGVKVWPEAPIVQLPLRFDGRLWAVSSPPFHIDDTWKQWLGIRAHKFAESNLFLVAIMPSGSAGVIDHENRDLEQRARFLYTATAIEGFLFEDSGMLVGGGHVPSSKALQVRSVSDTAQFFRPVGFRGPEVTERRLVWAAQITDNLERLSRIRPMRRLSKGVRSLSTGFESRFGEERLHSFVRSLEAIMQLEVGKSKRQFIHRGQVFAGRSDLDRKVLNELYDLRSCAEHMNSSEAVLGCYHKDERPRIAAQRAIQAEFLAKVVYQRILRSTCSTLEFADDDALARFWRQSDHELMEYWGAAADLHEIDLPPKNWLSP